MTPATPLDTKTLDGLRGFLSEDKLALLLQRYLEDTSRLIRQLGEACANGETAVAYRSAHSLKSTSANVGALSLSALARDLESMGQRGDLAAILARMDDLQGQFETVRGAIEGLPLAAQRSIAG